MSVSTERSVLLPLNHVCESSQHTGQRHCSVVSGACQSSVKGTGSRSLDRSLQFLEWPEAGWGQDAMFLFLLRQIHNPRFFLVSFVAFPPFSATG